MITYRIERHITTEWILTGQEKGDIIRNVIAKCPDQLNALIIKGMYEKGECEILRGLHTARDGQDTDGGTEAPAVPVEKKLCQRFIDNGHWVDSDYRQRMSIKEWREILSNNLDTIVFRGTVHKLTAKHLGNGVVEIFKLVEGKP